MMIAAVRLLAPNLNTCKMHVRIRRTGSLHAVHVCACTSRARVCTRTPTDCRKIDVDTKRVEKPAFCGALLTLFLHVKRFPYLAILRSRDCQGKMA